jgi:hypothetical protein
MPNKQVNNNKIFGLATFFVGAAGMGCLFIERGYRHASHVLLHSALAQKTSITQRI